MAGGLQRVVIPPDKPIFSSQDDALLLELTTENISNSTLA